MGRWVHVEAHDVLDLGGKGRVFRALECSDAVRLKPVGGPDPLDRTQGHAHDLGHCPSGPVRGFSWRFGAGQRQDIGHDRRGERRPPRRAGFVAQQSFYGLCGIASLPTPDCRSAGTGPPRHLLHGQALGRGQDDPGALDVLERSVPISDDRFQPNHVFRIHEHTYRLGHATRIAHRNPSVNRPNGSVH